MTVTGTGVATRSPDQCQLQIALNCMTDNAADALAVAICHATHEATRRKLA